MSSPMYTRDITPWETLCSSSISPARAPSTWKGRSMARPMPAHSSGRVERSATLKNIQMMNRIMKGEKNASAKMVNHRGAPSSTKV